MKQRPRSPLFCARALAPIALLSVVSGCVPDVPVADVEGNTTTGANRNEDGIVGGPAQDADLNAASDDASRTREQAGAGGGQNQAGSQSNEGEHMAGDRAGPAGAAGQARADTNTGGASGLQACESEGATRCAPGGGRRMDVCTSGSWIPSTPCPNGAVCSVDEATNTPACISTAEICQGSGGQKVCDGGGVMYSCSPHGVVEATEPCATARHCQAGLELGACPVCLAGTEDEYRCEGAELLRCSDAGDRHVPYKTCDTASLCNVVAGDCTDAACSPDQKVCDGDVLKECNADQTALVEAKTCRPGLCDAEAGDCDVCIPGSADCADPSSAVICNEEGTELVRMACPASNPACRGAGMCVECGKAGDCGEPGPCHENECVAGTCIQTPVSTGTCSGSFGEGFCVEGTCKQCKKADDCGEPEECHRWACENNSCVSKPNDTARCDGFCAGGNCVECRDKNDCDGDLGDCETATCTLGRCRTSALDKVGNECDA